MRQFEIQPVTGDEIGKPGSGDGGGVDEHIAGAVIGRDELLASVSDVTRQAWQAAGALVLPATDAALLAWLDAQAVDAVLLRPDRYVMGVATTSIALDAVSAGLPFKIGSQS